MELEAIDLAPGAGCSMQISRRGRVGGARGRSRPDPAGRRRERRGREVERAEIHGEGPEADAAAVEADEAAASGATRPAGRRMGPDSAGVCRARGVIRGRDFSSRDNDRRPQTPPRGTSEAPSSPRRRATRRSTRALARVSTLVRAALARAVRLRASRKKPRACGDCRRRAVDSLEAGARLRPETSASADPDGAATSRPAAMSPRRVENAAHDELPDATPPRTRSARRPHAPKRGAEGADARFLRFAGPRPPEKTPRCAADDSIAEHIGRSIAATRSASRRRRRVGRRTSAARCRAVSRHAGFVIPASGLGNDVGVGRAPRAFVSLACARGRAFELPSDRT